MGRFGSGKIIANRPMHDVHVRDMNGDRVPDFVLLGGGIFSQGLEVVLGQPGEFPRRFLRGDCNADGVLDVTDPIANLSFQFVGTFVPPCLDALDFDDSGGLDVTDPILSLTHQFLGGPAPAPPGKDGCGVDPTDDELSCASFAACPGDG